MHSWSGALVEWCIGGVVEWCIGGVVEWCIGGVEHWWSGGGCVGIPRHPDICVPDNRVPTVSPRQLRAVNCSPTVPHR